MDTFSNALFLLDNEFALTHLATQAVCIDKNRPETCCIIGTKFILFWAFLLLFFPFFASFLVLFSLFWRLFPSFLCYFPFYSYHFCLFLLLFLLLFAPLFTFFSLRPRAANYYARQGDHAKAILYFNRALEINSDYGIAWTLLGHEYLQVRNTNAAIDAYRRAVGAFYVCFCVVLC